jgi:hypothetical protein
MEDNNICGVCKEPIKVQIQKNTGLCSQKCEKVAKNQSIKSVSE